MVNFEKLIYSKFLYFLQPSFIQFPGKFFCSKMSERLSQTPWEKIVTFMSPGNLEKFDFYSKDYSDIAKCLGIGPKYDVRSSFISGSFSFS